MVKKVREYVYSFGHDTQMWQTDNAWQDRPQLRIASCSKNCNNTCCC